ncbi:unnamed protein product [Lasius platythorax]|uniref:Uncharacterized protein n=1 Tax=Lasius platythorax TaxID=488582 RepID=A0AAV2N4F7_9HYME
MHVSQGPGFGTPARIVSPCVRTTDSISHSLSDLHLETLVVALNNSPPPSVASDSMNRILLPQHLSDKRPALSPARLPFALSSAVSALQCLL